MWGCTDWFPEDGEKSFFDNFSGAYVAGFVDDSLVIIADSKEWSQETSDGYAIKGRGHQRLRVFNYRVQEVNPRWTDSLDNFTNEFNYVKGQLSDSVVWGWRTSCDTKISEQSIMSFWKIDETAHEIKLRPLNDNCVGHIYISKIRQWKNGKFIAFGAAHVSGNYLENALLASDYGEDYCQYAEIDTMTGSITYKRLDKNIEWIKKCDDVRAWGDDVYCVILDEGGENSLILKNSHDTISAPRKFAIGGFWGNMIKLSGNICRFIDDDITCPNVIWYGNELKFYQNDEVIVDLE